MKEGTQGHRLDPVPHGNPVLQAWKVSARLPCQMKCILWTIYPLHGSFQPILGFPCSHGRSSVLGCGCYCLFLGSLANCTMFNFAYCFEGRKQEPQPLIGLKLSLVTHRMTSHDGLAKVGCGVHVPGCCEQAVCTPCGSHCPAAGGQPSTFNMCRGGFIFPMGECADLGEHEEVCSKILDSDTLSEPQL